MKRIFTLMLALTMCLGLAACGSLDRKWRDTDEIDAYGTVMRNGAQIDVCVCHDQKAVYLYYNDEKHELFDTAKLPTDEIYDYDKDWYLGDVSLSDFTGDNNSDLQVSLYHSDMSESYIVWTWEEGAGYVYQPDDSWFYHSRVIYGPENIVSDFSMYEGLWKGDANNQFDEAYIEFDADGFWQLYSGGDAIDDGYLWYELEEDVTYIYSYQDGAVNGGRVKLEGDQLYISTLGYFDYLNGRGGQWQGDIGGNWDHENRKAVGLDYENISEFQGTWYLDGDLSAQNYIIIDSNGNWSYYQRTSGDPEATRIGCGTFSYSTENSYVYYANSTMYDGMKYQIYDFDEGILIWGDEGTYYRMK